MNNICSLCQQVLIFLNFCDIMYYVSKCDSFAFLILVFSRRNFVIMKQAKKYVVLAIFAVVIVVSLIYMGSVKINYNISDYLDESTETKISLNIMGEQFATTGNIQVMIEDITPEQVYEVYNVIKAVQGVRLVNFSTSDENYYKPNDDGKTGDALFAVIVEGDEYSLTATETLENIKAGLDDLFEGKTHYGGAVVEKVEMRNTMKKEIVI